MNAAVSFRQCKTEKAGTGVERINRIINNRQYQIYLAKNKAAEAQRCFCHHNMEHFLDVARIAMLLNLSEQYGLEKEIIYAAALLHDVGRWMQYLDGTPHEKASARLAAGILEECGFEEAQSSIIEAIANHRNAEIKEDKTLSGLLYRADKLSRPCYVCEYQKNCNWKNDKKNHILLW